MDFVLECFGGGAAEAARARADAALAADEAKSAAPPPPPPRLGMAESIARAPPVLKRQKSQSNNHQSVPADVYAVAGDKAKPFLSRQPSLPKMPIASLEAQCAKYLETVLPLLESAADEARTSAVVAAFLTTGDGPKLQALLEEYDAEQDNYVEHFYREIYTNYKGTNFNLNPNFVLAPLPGITTGPQAAAALAMRALGYHKSILDGTLAVFETRGKALCMRQMPWIFGTARVPVGDGSGPDAVLSHVDSSKHVVVLCQGHFYKVTVLGADGTLRATAALLERRFAEIALDASAQPAGGCVGALTTAGRGVWSAARARLAAASDENAASLAAVDEALFVVCLDAVSNLSPVEMERNVLYGLEGTYANRWLDKWAIIVTQDGSAGLNWEHSMLDGHTMMEFVATIGAFGPGEFMFDPDQAPEPPSAGKASSIADLPLAPLRLAVDAASVAESAEAVAAAKALSESLGVACVEFHAFGGNLAKQAQCSPDAFVQIALSLVYLALEHKLPAPYESVLAKAFKHGRVTVARNMSPLIAAGLKQFDALPEVTPADKAAKQEAFRAMCTDVSRICKDSASAAEFDRPFLAMRQIAKVEGLSFSLAEDPAWARMQDLGLCTSHCGKAPIRFFGYEPPSANGYSVGYFVDSNSIQACVTCFEKAKALPFAAALEARLLSLQALFA